MIGCYNGPYGECSEQMYKLYQLLKAKGVTLYNGFLPKDSFFFDIGSDRYAVWDEPDGNGLHMVWTKRYERDHRNPYQLVDEPLVENAELREFAAYLVKYVDPAGYQDICNIECPASTRCRGKSTCAFSDWALEKAKELGIDVD